MSRCAICRRICCCPGLETVPADAVLGLKTNRRFVEAYMVGLNVEMAHELLWRGFPTDQRGTCFDQFWDVRASPKPRPDINPLHTWREPSAGRRADGAGARAVRHADAQRACCGVIRTQSSTQPRRC